MKKMIKEFIFNRLEYNNENIASTSKVFIKIIDDYYFWNTKSYN